MEILQTLGTTTGMLWAALALVVVALFVLLRPAISVYASWGGDDWDSDGCDGDGDGGGD